MFVYQICDTHTCTQDF